MAQLGLSILPRVDFGPEQRHFLPQLQDLGLNIPAILGFSRWPHVLGSCLPFVWILQKPGLPPLGFMQNKSLFLGWVG